MLTPELLSSLNTKDKDEFQKTLLDIVENTIKVEKEFESIKLLLNNIIEPLPNAMWVIINDTAKILIQNRQSRDINELLNNIDFTKIESESSYMDRNYLINITFHDSYSIVIATDITEHKRSQRLAHMGQVAAHLAHEIKNPIGSVSLYASTLLKKVDVKSKPLVLEIKKSIWRVVRIVDTTLRFTQGVTANRDTFSLIDLKEDIFHAISNYTYSKDIEFNIEFEDAKICADLELMSLLFQNLIFNAIDAIEDDENDNGVVDITYKKTDNYYIFYIYDSGVPIIDESILFEAFETTKLKGNGLGLSLVKQIVDAHNGYIKLIKDKKGFEIGIKTCEK
jgi:signal transduction histidine kinase